MHPMYHPSFVSFLSYFNGNQDYFECHEELEEYWKEIAPRERKHPLTGYIQLATGLYHWRRGNFKGAITILKKGYATLQVSSDSSFVEAIDFDLLLANYKETLSAVMMESPFKAFQISIIDLKLNQLVADTILNLPPCDKAYILNKHKMRDRTDVINSRQQALLRRRSMNAKRSRH